MSFLDHLEELRWHIIRALGAVMVAATAAFLAKGFIFDILIFGPTKADFFTYEFLCNASKLLGFESFCDTNFDFEVQSRTMAGQFSAHIWTSITFGLIVAFPYVLYEFWKFISPGLYNKEKKQLKRFYFYFLYIVFYWRLIWILHCLPAFY